MLASTVQFSTYNQTPPPRPRRTQPTPRGNWWYEKQDGPEQKDQQIHPANRMSPLPQDPTACLRPRTPDDPVPRPRKRGPY